MALPVPPAPPNFTDHDSARAWLESNGYVWDRPYRGSPLYNYILSRISTNTSPLPIELARHLSDYEQDKLQHQHPPESGSWIANNRGVLYPHTHTISPAGPQPALNDQAAMRRWLEQVYLAGNQTLGSPFYQFVVTDCLRKEVDEEEIWSWVDHLSANERSRLEAAFEYHTIRFEPDAVVFYSDQEIGRWPVNPKQPDPEEQESQSGKRGASAFGKGRRKGMGKKDDVVPAVLKAETVAVPTTSRSAGKRKGGGLKRELNGLGGAAQTQVSKRFRVLRSGNRYESIV